MVRRVARDLAELVRSLAADPSVCTDGPPAGGTVEISVPLKLLLSYDEPEARELVPEAIHRQVREALVEASRVAPYLEPGAAWCLLCRRPGCPHSRPPDRQSVFAGYSPTGVPRWASFSELCLRREPSRAARLYGPRATLVAMVRRGSDLHRDLVPGLWGPGSGYEILGQVDLGFIPLQGERVAASLQALRVRPGGQLARVVLHWVGLDPRELEFDPDSPEGFDPGPLRALVATARNRLDAARLRSSRPGGGAEEVAVGILNRFKGGVERMARQRSRRTRHARLRREQPGRPLEGALVDAVKAGPGDIMVDERRKTFIVRGPKARVHVFSMDGRVITSLKLDRDAVRRRLSRERWRRATSDEVEAFRVTLQREDG